MRSVDLYLLDIAQACDHLKMFTDGMDLEGFLADEKTKSACVREIEIIGEAASQMRQRYSSFCNDDAEIPWSTLTSLRNAYTNGYHAISYNRVWETIQRDIPEVSKAISNIARIKSGDG